VVKLVRQGGGGLTCGLRRGAVGWRCLDPGGEVADAVEGVGMPRHEGVKAVGVGLVEEAGEVFDELRR
jgi:hypothetical protein